MEKRNQPGTARYGNFINYYSFNPPESRIGLIPKDLLNTVCDFSHTRSEIISVLDVGCNAGVGL